MISVGELVEAARKFQPVCVASGNAISGQRMLLVTACRRRLTAVTRKGSLGAVKGSAQIAR